MNRCFLIFVSLILSSALILSCCGSPSAARKSQRSAIQSDMIKIKIESGDYTINVSRAEGIRSIYLTSAYSLKVKDGNVDSYLPYFGRAYSLPYGGGEGLIFTGKAENYSLTRGKKNSYRIEFTVTTPEDNYRYAIDVSSNGSSMIVVIPMNKQTITFYGEVDILE